MKHSLTTKTGDQGFTSLCSGKRVRKDDPFVDICGDIDELVSFLGLARASAKKKIVKQAVLDLQKDLFVLASETASPSSVLTKLKTRIDAGFVADLEKRHAALSRKVPAVKDFIIPGESPSGAALDCARCIARRLERKIISLYRAGNKTRKHIFVWINRVSDYLFLLARLEERKTRSLK